MQGYTRKIAYLYEYKDGEQMKSAGFVKVEARGGVCRIDIHLLPHRGRGRESLYLFLLSETSGRNLPGSSGKPQRRIGVAGDIRRGKYSGQRSISCGNQRNLGPEAGSSPVCGGLGRLPGGCETFSAVSKRREKMYPLPVVWKL